MSYSETFRTRCDQYMYAVSTFPMVMHHEYETAVEMLNLSEEVPQTILHLQAGGIPLRSYLPGPNQQGYFPFETSPDFAHYGFPLCSYGHLPVADQSIDRFLILASLHHASRDERMTLYRELHRVMKPHGRVVLGDVRRGSKQDRWLNDFVHQHGVSGHVGVFFHEEEDLPLLQECGWTSIEVRSVVYPWVFDGWDSLLLFVRNLFGLKPDLTDVSIRDAVCEYLTVVEKDNNRIHIEWELVYYIIINDISTTTGPVPFQSPVSDTPHALPTVSM